MASEQMIVNVGANTSAFASAFRGLPGIAGGPLKVVAGSIAAVGAAVTAIGIKGVVEFSKFTEGVAKFGVMLNTVEKKQLPALSKGIRKASVEFGRSTDDLNKGMFDVISSGFRGAEALEVLNESTRLSVAGAADMAKSTSAVISLMKVYGDELENAEEATDFFFQTQLQARSSIDEMADTFGRLLPTAKAAGVELNSLGAMFSIVTLGGKSTAEAVTGLDSLILSLAAPTKRVAERFKEFGVNTKDAQGNLLDIRDIVKQMSTLDLEQIRRIVPEKEALNAFIILRDNIEQFPDVLSKMGESAGSTKKAFIDMAAEPAEKMRQLTQAVNFLFLELGEKLMPIANDVLNAFENLLDIFERKEVVAEFAHQVELIANALFETAKFLGLFDDMGTGIGQTSDLLVDLVGNEQDLNEQLEGAATQSGRFQTSLANTRKEIENSKVKNLEVAMASLRRETGRGIIDIVAMASQMEGGAQSVENLDTAYRKWQESQEGANLALIKSLNPLEEARLKTKELGDEAGKTIPKIKGINEAFAEAFVLPEAFGVNQFLKGFEDAKNEAFILAQDITAVFDDMADQGKVIGKKMATAMAEGLLEAQETLGAELSGEDASTFEKLLGFTPEAFEKMREDLESKIPELMEGAAEIVLNLPEELREPVLKALGTSKQQLDDMVTDTSEKMDLMGGIITTFGKATQKAGTAFAAFGIKGGSPFGKAMEKVAAVQDIISVSQAIWQLGLAAAEFASFNFPKATLHLAASSAYLTSAAAGKKAKGEIKANFATGGIVDGPAGIDNVPINATAGEGVLTGSTVSNILSDLTGQQPVGESPPLAGGGGDINIFINVEGDSLDNDGLVDKITPALESALAARTFDLQGALAR